MPKDPAFMFYSQDFITGTFTMTDKQVGQYIRLLCLQHQQGPLSEEKMLSVCKKRDEIIWSKFRVDENGLYYNRRLAEEVEKRRAHSEKQREKVLKRWNKSGTDVGNTAVLPLENENENENENIDKTLSYEEATDARAREAENPLEFPPAVKKAVAAYMDMFGSPPGGMVVEDIKDFAETMEADAIIRAFEVAAAENVAKWSYIKGILNRYRQDGVKTKADILRHEAEFQKKKLGAQKPQRQKQYTQASEHQGVKPSQNDVAQTRKFLDKLKEDE